MWWLVVIKSPIVSISDLILIRPGQVYHLRSNSAVEDTMEGTKYLSHQKVSPQGMNLWQLLQIQMLQIHPSWHSLHPNLRSCVVLKTKFLKSKSGLSVQNFWGEQKIDPPFCLQSTKIFNELTFNCSFEIKLFWEMALQMLCWNYLTAKSWPEVMNNKKKFTQNLFAK